MESRLHKEISRDELAAIVKHLHGEQAELLESHLLGGGMFNTTYFASTKKPDSRLVIRIGPINRQYLFKYEQKMMQCEIALEKKMRAAGIPVSKILQYVPAGEVIDREYLIVEYMDSISMSDRSLRGVDLSNVYYELGHYMKKLQSITTNGFGWPDADGNCPYTSWYDFVMAYAQENVERVSSLSLLSDEENKTFLDIIKSSKAVLDMITTPYMNHTDMWSGNVLLRKKDDGTYTIAALIDADRSIFGDRDIEYALEWMGNEHFFRGYGAIDFRDEYSPLRRDIYHLLLDYFYVYIWRTQYDEVPTSERSIENIRTRIQRMTSR